MRICLLRKYYFAQEAGYKKMLSAVFNADQTSGLIMKTNNIQ